jgi:TBC1 domain family protein 5
MMLRILFIYARQTPQLSYKQGMHELLAPIVYLVNKESIENKESINPLEDK